MQAKSTKINFKGQNVYAGIDVHLKSWKKTVMLEQGTFSQDPSAEIFCLRSQFLWLQCTSGVRFLKATALVYNKLKTDVRLIFYVR
jgi:hypothetical protein